MATRAIKKLTKKDDIKKIELEMEKNKKESDLEESEEEPIGPINKFNLLDEQLEEQENLQQDSNNEPQTEKATKKKNKKRNKPKSKSKKNEEKNLQESGFKFVSTIVDEDETLDSLNNLNLYISKNYLNDEKIRKLFQIESKNLNSENEMIRMFGAKIVQAERNSQRGNQRRTNRFKTNSIVNQKSSWPPFIRLGLSMRLIKESTPGDNTVEFLFEHSRDYQNVQFAFLDSIESLNHNNIINVLQINPYHIDSLIQLSDVSRMHDDTQMAADLIERALFAIQNSFHPSFKFTSNTNQIFQLDYNRIENRGFFIALFKHLLYIGGKACYRTSLELCKLLLSLDIQGDPLGVILLIDFYAIRSSSYEYLIDFYEAFNDTKHLHLMPNMSFSYALSHFYLYKKTNDAQYLQKANKHLKESLCRFPAILMEMLDKCNVVPDKQAESHKFFAKTSYLKIPEGLKYLLNLYVTRMHYEWKIAENLQWLEQNVKEIITNEKMYENFLNENKNKCKSLFSKVPSNLYRHLILSDLKEVAVHLPPEYPSTATYTFDPIPPKNTIISYIRPQRTQPTQQHSEQYSRADSLLTFFQSLLPSFNAQNLNVPRDIDQAAGAEGGARFDMNQMVGRLRDFLANIDQHFPAIINEADGAENNNNDDLNDLDEFD